MPYFTAEEIPDWTEMDEQSFQTLAENHRREIQFHCYRMLGSMHDAEDLVQETFLRALRGRHQFEGRSSLRTWLYRIATNGCLNVLSKRKIQRRILPDSPLNSESSGDNDTKHNSEILWLEPYPDAAWVDVPDPSPGPGTRYEMRETVRLAFMVAIQYLPPRQRAIILLRDALGWSADETARALDISVASANSALQRARATLAKEFPSGSPHAIMTSTEQNRTLLEQYVKAWETADLDGLIAMLKHDAILNMPPLPQWYRGREIIRKVLADAWSGCHAPPFRVTLTSANDQSALALYSFDRTTSRFKATALNLVEWHGESINKINLFFDTSLFPLFALPLVLSKSASSQPAR